MRLLFTQPAAQLGSRVGSVRAWEGAINRRNHADWGVCNDALRARDSTKFGAWTDDSEAAKLARLEAVLLLVREPQNTRKLAQHANLADGTEARTLIRRLNERYDRVGRAFRVEQVAGGYQLLTRRKFASWLRRLGHVPPELRLSAPALETLAVIAYRQPTSRADIEAIRGVNCGEILRQLLERDLVRIGGRSEDLGRPYLYCTTRTFLQTFGLVSLDELPRAEALRVAEFTPVALGAAFSAALPDPADPHPSADDFDEPETGTEFEFISED